MSARLGLMAVTLLLAACANAPRQTVELAESVNDQIAHMQTSHESFVRLYYRGLRQDVDEFMAQTWIPKFLSNIVTGRGEGGKAFRAQLDRGYTLLNVDWEKAIRIEGIQDPKTVEALRAAIKDVEVRSHGELGRVLIDFSTASQHEIQKQRRLLLDPIDAQEAFVLDELRKGYVDLLAGTASLKGYLASVVKLTEKRDEISAKLGILDDQRALLNSAMKINEDIFKVAPDEEVDLKSRAKKLTDWLDKVRDKIKK